MRRCIAILIVSLFGTIMLYAQTPLERMNSIKMSDEYIWDEYTHPSADTATVGAIQRLLLYIEVPEGRTLTEDDIRSQVKFIKIKRSNLTRMFAYIKKEDVKNILGVDVKQKSRVEEIPTEVDSVMSDPIFEPTPIAEEVMRQSDFYAVYKYIENQKLDGKISSYGALKDTQDIGTLNLVIFDKQTQRAVCVLSPVTTGESRINLVSGNTDALVNYEDGNHIAIWFDLKQ